MLNETERDWQAMFLPYGEQQEALYAMEGQPVSSKTLAGGNPFHFSDLEDPHGSVLGFTLSGGNFLLIFFMQMNRGRITMPLLLVSWVLENLHF